MLLRLALEPTPGDTMSNLSILSKWTSRRRFSDGMAAAAIVASGGAEGSHGRYADRSAWSHRAHENVRGAKLFAPHQPLVVGLYPGCQCARVAGLPSALQPVVNRHAEEAAVAQRQDVGRLNAGPVELLRSKGMIVNEADTSGLRKERRAFFA